MSKPLRLDAELVRRRLVSSRSEAQEAIERGLVVVRGLPVTKAAARVTADAPISLVGAGRRFVSRGGDKLEGALQRFDVKVAGRDWLDAGASTGGFTDCLLDKGAARVAAVDVGYGQLDWRIRNDGRVTVLERTNVRSLTVADLPFQPEGVVADLSFISLVTVMDPLVSVSAPDADFVLLVKPQFEAGREAVGKGGVVRDPAIWREAVGKVVDAGATRGVGLVDAAVSSPPGPAGNLEFFVHLRAGAPGKVGAIEAAIGEASG